jgi:hypothetical protein
MFLALPCSSWGLPRERLAFTFSLELGRCQRRHRSDWPDCRGSGRIAGADICSWSVIVVALAIEGLVATFKA